MVVVEVVPGDGVERRLALAQLDLLPPGQGAEAVAVRHDHGPGHLQHLRELRVVYLGAGDHDPRAEPGLRLRLARFELLQCLAQEGQDEVLRAGQARELHDVELVARDDGVFRLAQRAHLRYDAAQLVVLRDGGAQALLREVHAVGLAQGFEDLLLHLAAVVADVPLAAVYRHVDAGDEELLLRDEAAVFKVLLHAVHGAAALLADERVQEVVAALEGALQYALGIGT